MRPAKNDSPWKAWFVTYGPRLLLFARQQARNQRDADGSSIRVNIPREEMLLVRLETF
jgi:hypothetical protein